MITACNPLQPPMGDYNGKEALEAFHEMVRRVSADPELMKEAVEELKETMR